MSHPRAVSGRKRALVITLDRSILWFSRHWLAVLNSLSGLYVFGALLAPALMRAGLSGPATALYTFYGFSCHQLPQRSYFLFGHQLMYPMAQLLEAWPQAQTLWQQRAILGDPAFGYKVAIATRCSAIYPAILFAGLLYATLRGRFRPLPFWGFLALTLPMVIDGGSHLLSEVSRLGFRETNAWLQLLTSDAFARDFYVGDALGSFNWLMRTVTGALFGLGTVWFAFPYVKESADEIKAELTRKLERTARVPPLT